MSDGKTGRNGTDTPELCTLCPRLAASRHSVVLPDTRALDPSGRATVAFVGEAPGEEEDQQARPFVGPAGRLLRRLIAAYVPYSYAILNLIMCRPVENGRNGKPSDQEARTCRDTWLLPMLRSLQPLVIVTLGSYPFAYLSRRPLVKVRMEEVVGKAFRFRLSGQEGYLVPMYHPAYILRNPQKEALYEKDFQRLRRFIDQAVQKEENKALQAV